MNNIPYWYLASYPKSGNTWIRVFINEVIRQKNFKEKEIKNNILLDIHNKGCIVASKNLINDHAGIDCSDLSLEEINKLRPKIDLSKVNFNNFPYFKIHDNFFCKNNKTPIASTKGCKGIVYIVRNPLDIIISLSYFFSWDINSSAKFLLNENSYLCNTLSRGLELTPQFLGSWSSHVDSWHQSLTIPRLTIRYEDMLNSPHKVFNVLSNFLELNVDQEIIKRAIKNTSFSSLKKNEKKIGGFPEKPKECKEFFRSGKTGEGIAMIPKDIIYQVKETLHNKMKLFQS